VAIKAARSNYSLAGSTGQITRLGQCSGMAPEQGGLESCSNSHSPDSRREASRVTRPNL
jgi:hypothetical protein